MVNWKSICSSEIEKGLFNYSALVSAFLFVVIIIISSISEIIDAIRCNGPLSPGMHYHLIILGLKSNSVTFFVPLLAAFPYSTSYCEELKSRFILFYIQRCSRTQYIIGKLVGCIFSGGGTLLLGISITTILYSIAFSPFEGSAVNAQSRMLFLDLIHIAIPFFLSGSLWSTVGLTISAIMESKYIALASPFSLYYLLIIIKERYFKKLCVFNPREWLLCGTNEAGIQEWRQLLIVFELIILMSVFFFSKAERRLREL